MENRDPIRSPVHLGSRATWIGPAIFAFAVLVYTLAMGFDSLLHENWNKLFVGAADRPAMDVVHLVLEWRALVLLLIGAGLGALAAASWSLYIGMWAHRRQIQLQFYVFLVLVGILGLVYVLLAADQGVLARLASNVHGGLPNHVKIAAEIVAVLVGLGGAALLVLPGSLDATELRRRVHAHRLLLYVAAILLTITTLMVHTTFVWLLPEASPVALAGTLATGAMYTLMLASVFVPAGIGLDWAARQLARASEGENPTDQQSWLAQNDIAVDWKTRLTKTVALLAPFLSSGLGPVQSQLGQA
jgi:hypothetical protein